MQNAAHHLLFVCHLGANPSSPLRKASANVPNGLAELISRQADLMNEPAGLMNEPADLMNGQADLANGLADLANGQSDLTNGQADLTNKRAKQLRWQSSLRNSIPFIFTLKTKNHGNYQM